MVRTAAVIWKGRNRSRHYPVEETMWCCWWPESIVGLSLHLRMTQRKRRNCWVYVIPAPALKSPPKIGGGISGTPPPKLPRVPTRKRPQSQYPRSHQAIARVSYHPHHYRPLPAAPGRRGTCLFPHRTPRHMRRSVAARFRREWCRSEPGWPREIFGRFLRRS
jgi:hypothetical protein